MSVKLNDAQYEWNPIGQRPRYPLSREGDCIVYSRTEHLRCIKEGYRNHQPLTMSMGACVFERQNKPHWEQVALMMVDFHTMVVRDGLDPQTVHREFLKIDEYRRFISPDCEGAE